MRRALFIVSLFCCMGISGLVEAQAPLATSAQSTAEGGATNYILGAGDQIRVTVFGEQDISGDYLIDSAGAITVPLVGRVLATGRTTDQVAQSVAEQLSRGYFVQNARVTARIIAYRPFYILGEVEKPGAYPYAPDMNAYQAVATAGGYTERANRRRIFIRRAGQSHEEAVRADGIIEVHPGDTLRIGERFF